MLRSYFKIAIRNLIKNKGYTFINIAGLASGMTVALLIGLWIWDEITYNTYHKNYDRLAQVWQHNLYNGVKASQVSNPYVMAEEIRNTYGSDFKYVLQSTWNFGRVLTVGDKMFSKAGMYWEPGVLDMLSIKLIHGSPETALKDPHSILLSQTVSSAYFGDSNPVGQTMRVNNQSDVKVTGVYEDLPYNSNFRTMTWIMPWDLYIRENTWIKSMEDPWGSNFTQTWVQLADHADMQQVSDKIVNVKFNKLNENEKKYKPEVFLHPMSKWHLYSEFKEGKNTGGRIEFVWMFGVIGVFVLLLACINFMNLSTARSEKRAKEVGIRKSIGSMRAQLVSQFFSESVLMALFAFVVTIGLVYLALPWFNSVADKKIELLWSSPLFWLIGIGFSVLTGILAGSYPALYLSSFQPVQVLKGTFRAGRGASLPRQVLVVLQFSVSVILIIGTVVVFRQIQFAKNRPIGYERNGLINVYLQTNDIHKHFDAVRNELKTQNAIVEMTEAGAPTTQVWNSNGGFTWSGKDPSLAVDFPNNGVNHEFGKTVGWKFKEGRDFSRDFASDSLTFVINEAMARFLGFEKPVGETLTWNDTNYKIIGIIEDMVIESPYEPVRPSLWHIDRYNNVNLVILKLNPDMNAAESLEKIKTVFTRYSPSSPFSYEFVDAEYARKFEGEERIGKLASAFAGLAIFISCLGIFGLASFVAEQRTKEIGVRKVMGASVTNLWAMLSKDFVVLVSISLLVAMPLSWYFMSAWLQKYQYRSDMAWWIFAAAGVGALLITLLTVSYQSIKAAMANPVKSLRSE
ncbi:MAG TPA: ABC transporter permease [Cyclobacteriaceae bacterium]|jgi:putative ABC transport system permease protein|nr:ABC transporter permease [Cytophagales bacterium]HRE67063.1 ABC transporter permease [Cyclobacteriaceae bacterium]HRF32326.1 ABC transporter permease [Cyclobacteriaceae bacterium]